MLQAVGSSSDAARSAFIFAETSAVVTRLVRFLNDCSSSSQSKHVDDASLLLLHARFFQTLETTCWHSQTAHAIDWQGEELLLHICQV